MPGAGFDRQGGRMGWGMGIMIDFSRNFHQVHLWAYVGLSKYGMTPIPMDALDQRMSKIVTEQGIIHCV